MELERDVLVGDGPCWFMFGTFDHYGTNRVIKLVLIKHLLFSGACISIFVYVGTFLGSKSRVISVVR